jgi:serine/threonine protein kinase
MAELAALNETPREGWAFEQGAEVVPGVLAWARLDAGRRFEAWAAWSVPHWCAAVVKLPRPDRVDETSRAHLAREHRLASRLCHPHIQRVLSADTEGDVPYVVFEYVEGPTVDDLVHEGEGPLLPGDAVRLVAHVAGALHYVHGRGIVHLDVKPANVVVRDGRPVLIDFDVAAPIGEVARLGGTSAYMAPEQIIGEPAAPSMDVFALGVLLYEAVTGADAFDPVADCRPEEHPQLHSSPVPAASLVPDLPQSISSAIDALLARRPRDRPSNGTEALALLNAMELPGEGLPWPEWMAGYLPTCPRVLRAADRRGDGRGG